MIFYFKRTNKYCHGDVFDVLNISSEYSFRDPRLICRPIFRLTSHARFSVQTFSHLVAASFFSLK